MSGTDSSSQRADTATGIDGLEGRLAKVEKKLEGGGKDFWDKLQAGSSVIIGVAGVVITVLLTHALEVRRLEIAEGTATRELLLMLRGSEISKAEAEAAAISLAAYGRAAIAPLVTELQSSEPIRRQAAEAGLKALALNHRKAVCPTLIEILRNRTRLFSSRTHLAAIRMVGIMDCQEARQTLSDYGDLISEDNPDALESYRAVVSKRPQPFPDDLEELREDLEESLQLLDRGRPQT